MYSGSLSDSFQLAVSVNCLSLLVIISVVYLVYFLQTREKTFLSGVVVTVDIMLFVLAETLIILMGWWDNVPVGRLLHRAEQVPIYFFLVSLPYFLQASFPAGGFFKVVLKVMFWAGLVFAVAVSAAGYIFPDSLVSITEASLTPPESPGDFTRGLEGPLYKLRDISLSIYIFLAIVYSIFYLLKSQRNFQNIMLLFGLTFSIFGGIDDMQYLYTGRNLLLDGLRFSRFTLGATLMMIFFLAAVFSRYFEAHTRLLEKTHDLEISEGKYSLLMDAADEILFSLSAELKIISANHKAEHLFSLHDQKKNFMDCLYHSEFESMADNQYYREQLLELWDAGSKLSFNTYIEDPVTREPVEYHFRFDCFEGDDLELIGRAWKSASSRLLEFVDTERLSLKVDNYIVLVGDIVDRLTSNLKRYLEEGEVMMLKMGLQEMIINAMEHGNLNVTFDEKTKAQEEDRLFEFMSERRQLPEYRNNKVMIDYFFDETKVVYRITDMGPGFNYKQIMARVKNEVNQQELSHGRGIIMTQAVFSSVEYNRKGNQVLCIKEFSKG
ncbi:MAG: ATP-binding protein [Spirochaetales bacterium]|nr:ATP-binding protein [Spirochaetales bacterium]